MRAGELPHRITLQRLTRTRVAGGGSTEEWVDFLTVPAKVESAGGRELFVAERLAARVTHTVKIRYRDGVEPLTWRGKFRGVVLRFVTVSPANGKRDALRILAEETVNS